MVGGFVLEYQQPEICGKPQNFHKNSKNFQKQNRKLFKRSIRLVRVAKMDIKFKYQNFPNFFFLHFKDIPIFCHFRGFQIGQICHFSNSASGAFNGDDVFYPAWKLAELDYFGVDISNLKEAIGDDLGRGMVGNSREWNFLTPAGKIAIPWAVDSTVSVVNGEDAVF